MTIGEIYERLRALRRLVGLGASVADIQREIDRTLADIERYQRSLGLRP